MSTFAAIVLAAGQGKRMHSSLPKVLHPLHGRPLLAWVLEMARAAGAERIVAVLGYGREQVAATLPPDVEWVVQEEQRGTGHAARCAESLLRDYPGPLAVLSGDVPLLRVESLRELVERQRSYRAAVALLTVVVQGVHSYGRIVRGADGAVRRIVEHKDATPEERRIEEINTGTYVFGPGELFPVLAGLKTNNAQGEYYLTDTLEAFVRCGKKVVAEVAPRADECLGINTLEELAAADQALAHRRRDGT